MQGMGLLVALFSVNFSWEGEIGCLTCFGRAMPSKRRRSAQSPSRSKSQGLDWVEQVADRFDEGREAHYPQQPAAWRWSSAAAATSSRRPDKLVPGTEAMHWKAQRAAADLDQVRLVLSASPAAFEPDRFAMVIAGRPVQVAEEVRGSWFGAQSVLHIAEFTLRFGIVHCQGITQF